MPQGIRRPTTTTTTTTELQYEGFKLTKQLTYDDDDDGYDEDDDATAKCLGRPTVLVTVGLEPNSTEVEFGSRTCPL
jgi:hypothetical protein